MNQKVEGIRPIRVEILDDSKTLSAVMNNAIMLVDDEELVLKTLQMLLSKSGYTVRASSTGKEALEILQDKNTEDIRVFILDLKMAGMDGTELCRAIKKLKPDSCVYALSGYASEYHIKQCRESGFDDYFTKPFKIDQILEAVKNAFDKIERWDDLSEE